MNLAVLSSPSSWYVDDLRRAAGDEQSSSMDAALLCSFRVVGYRELASLVAADEIGIRSGSIDLHEFDALLVRSMPPGSLEQVVFRMNALDQ